MTPIDSLLYRALHRFRRSDDRWAELRKAGSDDDAIRARISYEFGSHASFGGPGDKGASFDGGPKPRFWVGSVPVGKPTLEGQELVDAVRKLLRIPRPRVEPEQKELFGETQSPAAAGERE